jgi:hypothetical protein
MTLGFTCWRCEELGHTAAECKPERATTPQELEERIARLVERWQAFEITRAQKTEWIEDEMAIFHFKKARAK